MVSRDPLVRPLITEQHSAQSLAHISAQILKYLKIKVENVSGLISADHCKLSSNAVSPSL